MVTTRSKRPVTIGIAIAAGPVLFAAGLAVGAIAQASRPIPSPRSSQGGTEPPAVFVLDCYDSSTPARAIASRSYRTAATAAGAMKDPSAVCTSIEQARLTQDAILSQAQMLQRQGQRCGYVDVIGGPSWLWQAGADQTSTPTISLTDGTSMTAPTGCSPPVTIMGPSLKIVPLAACMRAPDRAVMYPRGTAPAAEVCAAHGEEVWVR
ncbi:MAG TPA: hypothetical protein VGC18_09220 [Lacisediminihabitans sp.]|uniref:hypothetical protein n=1 Tax=Lacisediminihabitans sp. TaxID=2787631 RepID=UPI002EDABA2E